LFQIGGYNYSVDLMKKASIYPSLRLPLRIPVPRWTKFFLFAFTDGGWGRNNSQNTDVSYGYFGTGLGLAFETKVGIFNLAWAVGKRSDLEFNLRQSKIHFGFVNYF
jgi:hemolysin activation/secretion protein